MSDNADMKMADEFELPLKWGDDLDPKEVKVFKCGGDAAEYAVHAINTHDTLTAENKALRGSLEKVVKLLEANHKVITANTGESEVAQLNKAFHGNFDALNKARAALKLGEGL